MTDFAGILKPVNFLVETRQSEFPDKRHCRKQLGMQSILHSFGSTIQKRINNGFGTKIEIKNSQLF